MLKEKEEQLIKLLKSYGSVVVAYSGGVDSNYLLHVAKLSGIKSLAVTFVSELNSKSETERAISNAKSFGVTHRLINIDILSIDEVKHNKKNRCYICKKFLFSNLKTIAENENYTYVIDGSNIDDRGDFRPGRAASKELGVKSPLEESNLTKSDIRQLSKAAGLLTWDIPSFACFASRFEYDSKLTVEKINKVSTAEEGLHALGLRSARVRYHGSVARVETDNEDFKKITSDMTIKSKAICIIKNAGFIYVSIDLEGYRTGSMNKVLNIAN